MDINAAGSSNLGVSDEKIAVLADYATSEHYTETERMALELADAMTQAAVVVPLELYERLRAEFDEAQMVELAATIAMENFRARFNRVFEIEPNALYCPVDPSHKPAN